MRHFKPFALSLAAALLIIRVVFLNIGVEGEKDRWKDIIGSDGASYYLYLTSFFIQHDPSLSFVYQEPPYGLNLIYAGAMTHPTKPDKKYIKHYAGVAVAVSPAFAVTAIFSSFFREDPITGYEPEFYWAISMWAIFVLLLGLWALFKLLQHFEVGTTTQILTGLLLVFGTNLLHYTVFEPLMSHVYSFALVALSALLLVQLAKQYDSRKFLLLGFCIGLIALIRPVNVLFLAFVPALIGLSNFGNLVKYSLQNFGWTLASIVLSLLVFSIQPLFYYWFTGDFWIYAYQGEGFDFRNPKFFESIWSSEKGLFLYAPVLALAFVGTLFHKNNKWALLLFVAAFSGINYFFSSWWCWHYSGALGLRPWIEFYPFFAVFIALAIQQLMHYNKWIVWPIAVVLMANGAVFQYQYHLKILPYFPISWEQFKLIYWQTSREFRWVFNEDVAPINDKSLVYKTTIEHEADSFHVARQIGFEKLFLGPPEKNKNTVALLKGKAKIKGVNPSSVLALEVIQLPDSAVLYSVGKKFQSKIYSSNQVEEFELFYVIPPIEADSVLFKVYGLNYLEPQVVLYNLEAEFYQ